VVWLLARLDVIAARDICRVVSSKPCGGQPLSYTGVAPTLEQHKPLCPRVLSSLSLSRFSPSLHFLRHAVQGKYFGSTDLFREQTNHQQIWRFCGAFGKSEEV
jgi:hypothetical protein